MTRILFTALALMLAALQSAARADTVIAAGTIRGQTLIMPSDVALVAGTTPGALADLADAIGMEAAVNLYAGRPIRPGDLRPPAIVERNASVTLRYHHGGLLVVTEGRALDRAAQGEPLRVLNLASRNTVTATAAAPGLVIVGPNP
ncbi:flagellar basal body P-ring formation chaperone FlgA [Roseicyclus mahoneyensis]|uniref:Flagella basal body P-ring formation protein FlgA n=1 Tax=Roseicyclus mahoneyensis TaxID=164332 RepID=A0A316GFS2_9RHOB|nr:flagellar basal body P-ring formation chaperone FlgA [Roseicyclus mahoneyensis]PWK59800.1 flagella basal body P-ring formation protein FlgA [Roseicyclus mahoneyensis]